MFVHSRSRVLWSVTAASVAAMGLITVVGCGKSSGLQDVEGRVIHKDGSPLVGATVMFRSYESREYATGVTDNNGHYALGKSRTGEGVSPGDYSVLVMEDRGDEDNMRPPTIHRKYSLPNRSGLTFTVEPGGEDTFDIVLDPP